DQVFQGYAAISPFVEDRPAEQVDHRRQVAGHGFQLRRATAVKAGQLERVFDTEFGQHIVVRKVLDNQHHIAQVAGERLGKLVQGRPGDRLDVIEAWRDAEADHSAAVSVELSGTIVTGFSPSHSTQY